MGLFLLFCLGLSSDSSVCLCVCLWSSAVVCPMSDSPVCLLPPPGAAAERGGRSARAAAAVPGRRLRRRAQLAAGGGHPRHRGRPGDRPQTALGRRRRRRCCRRHRPQAPGDCWLNPPAADAVILRYRQDRIQRHRETQRHGHRDAETRNTHVAHKAIKNPDTGHSYNDTAAL